MYGTREQVVDIPASGLPPGSCAWHPGPVRSQPDAAASRRNRATALAPLGALVFSAE